MLAGRRRQRGQFFPNLLVDFPLGTGVTINDVWFEHTTLGVALGETNISPVNLVVSNCRVRDTLADGVHIFRSPQNCSITNTTARSTGDDSLNYPTVGSGNNSIAGCTVQTPWRADCYAFYGGNGNVLSNCEGYDTAVHAGVNASLQFNALTFGPEVTTIENVNLYRCGGHAYNGSGQYQSPVGAVWVDAATDSIAAAGNVPALQFDRVNIYEPIDIGLHLQSENGDTEDGVIFTDINIDHPAAYGIYVSPGTTGSGDFNYVSIYQPIGGMIDSAAQGTYNLRGAYEMASSLVYPAFFANQTNLASGIYYLGFVDGNPFGYYSFLSDPDYLYHFDLGYEYVFDAGDSRNGVYLYDFASNGFFYTSPSFPFPYLYDFALKSTVYYYPDPNNAARYNTNGMRYFYVFNTGQIISK